MGPIENLLLMVVSRAERLNIPQFPKWNGLNLANFTNLVDFLAGRGWVICDDVIRRLRSEGEPAGSAKITRKYSQDMFIKLISCISVQSNQCDHSNNLTKLPIRERHPNPQPIAMMESKMTNANGDWFCELWGEDLRLVSVHQQLSRRQAEQHLLGSGLCAASNG